WRKRIKMSFGAKGLIGYLYSTKWGPTDPASTHLPAWIPTTPAKIKAQEDYNKSWEEWAKNNYAACQQMCCTIPESLYVHILHK
ncbi:hypothetical protein PAXRUDRAFT_71111, partial [Paxillus rubicundulus Ve08.2h10]